MSEVYIRIPRRAIPVGAIVVVVALLAAVPGPRDFVGGAIGKALDRTTVADQPTLDAQRHAAEVAIARGYLKGADQLRQVRELRLPISADEANKIHEKAISDLKAVKHAALVSVGNAYGTSPDEAQEYAKQLEGSLESAPDAAEPAVLLAPRLYGIVSRANELFGQIADQATRDLTSARATPSPTRSPAPTATTTPSPSPTRR